MFFESLEASEADYCQLETRFPVSHFSDRVVYNYAIEAIQSDHGMDDTTKFSLLKQLGKTLRTLDSLEAPPNVVLLHV
jgi:hypothetical protein